MRSRPVYLLHIASAVFWLLAAAPASAATLTPCSVWGLQHVTINNGLSPPNPANVITSPLSPPNLCVEGPTGVAIAPGGSVTGEARAYQGSSIDVAGGFVGGTLFGIDSASITLSDGTVGRITTQSSASALITGGLVHSIGALESSLIQMTGGSFTSASSLIAANDAARIEIFGADFRINGDPVDFGPISTTHPYGRLTGTLASGEPLDVDYRFEHLGGSTSTINLVFQQPIPEPSTALLLALGLVGIAAARRRRAAR